jgi:hypothetical protein
VLGVVAICRVDKYLTRTIRVFEGFTKFCKSCKTTKTITLSSELKTCSV